MREVGHGSTLARYSVFVQARLQSRTGKPTALQRRFAASAGGPLPLITAHLTYDLHLSADVTSRAPYRCGLGYTRPPIRGRGVRRRPGG